MRGEVGELEMEENLIREMKTNIKKIYEGSKK